MNKNLLPAALLSIPAAAALVLSLRSPVTPEAIIASGAVVAILGIAALEYRIDWKRIFGRS